MRINNILLVVVLVLVIGLASLSFYIYQENTKVKKILEEDTKQIENLTQEIENLKKTVVPEEINDWNLYTNDKLGFKIRYPRDWMVEEEERIGLPIILFWPAGPRPEPEPISIGVRFGPCIPNGYDIYISESAFGLNTAYKLHTKERILTLDGLEGVRTTWFTRTWDQELGLRTCLPDAIFEHCTGEEDTSKAILISAGDYSYLDIFNAMVQTFEFDY